MQRSTNEMPVGEVSLHAPAPYTESEVDTDIDVIEIFYRLIENFKYIVAFAVAGAIITALITAFVVTPMYKATSKLYVLNSDETAINLSDLQIGTYLASDYQEVFKNWHVHERVIQALDLPYSYKELSEMLTINNPNDTRILYIEVLSPDPHEAKRIADTYAQVAREFIATTMDSKEPSIFEEALLPTSPSSPSYAINIAVGFLGGLIICCAIITARFLMDDKIRSSADIEKYLDLTVLGMVPMQTKAASNISPKR